jgi:hypothetical protein
MKVGGGGNERYMIIVPAFVGFWIIVYALGGITQTLIILENVAQDGVQWVRSLL